MAVTSASADAVCSADDTRQECLNNDSDIVDGKYNDIGADADCIDENSQCRSWSQDGECENNPGYSEYGSGYDTICIFLSLSLSYSLILHLCMM